ncbi:MAG: MarR family winged helix-turn-helix transcriptional regulator [Cellvibrionaceae bacterium]
MNSIQKVLITLRRIIRAVDLHSKHLAKTAGLTAPQLLLLQAIRDCGDVTIGELAKGITLSQATVTTILDRLEKRELVCRVRSQTDKRKVNAYLTQAGKEMLNNAPTPLRAHFIHRFRALPEQEQNRILSALEQVARMMDAEHIDASPFLEVGDLVRRDKSSSKMESVTHHAIATSKDVITEEL